MIEIGGPALAGMAFSLVALLAYEGLVVRPLRRRARTLEGDAQLVERALESVGQVTAELAADRRRLQERIAHVEEQIAQLRLRTDSRPYEQAIDLAGRGAAEDRLSATLGLTAGEAQLVRLLHGRRAPPGAGSMR